MKVDVSEIKTFKTCKRQWELSSRNRFHMRPRVTPPSFALGTIFHEALAQMYLGVPVDEVMRMVRREMQSDSDAALLAMVPGYYKEVLPEDLERFKVLDVEHHFEIEPKHADGTPIFPMVPKTDPKTGEVIFGADGEPVMESSLIVVGSIDMIVLDIEENKIYGFEHKTCKNFRDATFLWMDEQPRLYTEALKQYVERYNARLMHEWHELGCPKQRQPVPVQLGGVYLNEVKKLLRQFQYQRTLCVYPEEDMANFMEAFYRDCAQCKHAVDNKTPGEPKPSYFGCNGCSFNTICSTYMYGHLNEDEVLEEFSEEFVKRTEDHLEEKAERSGE